MASGRKYDSSNDKFYHSREWQAVRQQVLSRDGYLCQVCKRAGRLTPATTVHHITPVRVDPSKRLDPSNLECICKACHNQEHTERAKSKQAKAKQIKQARRAGVVKFKANPEMF